jgi:hypothetical protein
LPFPNERGFDAAICYFASLRFPFHGVLGALKQRTLVLHDLAQLSLAATNAGFFEQVRVHASQRPNAETASQVLWRCFQRGSQCNSTLLGCTRAAHSRLAGNQAIEHHLRVSHARDVDRPDAAAQSVGDRCLRSLDRAHKSDHRIAKRRRIGCSESQIVQRMSFLAGQFQVAMIDSLRIKLIDVRHGIQSMESSNEPDTVGLFYH